MIRVSILAVLVTILPVLVTMCMMIRVSLPFVSFVMTARMSVSLVMAMCTAMSLVMSMAMSMPLVMAMSAAVSTSVSMAVSMVVVVTVMARNIVVRDSCILVKGCNDRVAYFLHVLFLVLLLLLVVFLELLSVLHHLLNLVLGQPALVVGDGDLRLLTSRLVQGAHVRLGAAGRENVTGSCGIAICGVGATFGDCDCVGAFVGVVTVAGRIPRAR